MEVQGVQGEAGSSGGWPLGLQPVTLRMRLAEAFRAAESNSFITATPSFSSVSSSDLDTESSLSFFPDKSITLGSLIGLGTDPAPRHSLSSVHPEGQRQVLHRESARSSGRWWNFMRCASFRDHRDDRAPSLGHFLQAERQAEGLGGDEKVYINIIYEEAAGFDPEPNPLFDSVVAAPSTSRGVPAGLPVIEECPERKLSPRLKDGNPGGVAKVKTAHRRSQSQGSCVVNCVSNIWGWAKANPSSSNASQSKKIESSNRRKAIPNPSSSNVTSTNCSGPSH